MHGTSPFDGFSQGKHPVPWAHVVWMVRRPCFLINHHGYNIPSCSYNLSAFNYNDENYKNILKHFKIIKIVRHLQSEHSVTTVIVRHLQCISKIITITKKIWNCTRNML
jgi:hypothetical protein